MKQRRLIYALLMAVVYITATSMSSLSIITCDHHHHHHHEAHEHHDGCSHDHCHCNDLTISEDCCSHHHPILGDNHTDYITSSERNNSRTYLLLALILSPTLIGEEYISEPAHFTTLHGPTSGDEATPLLAALTKSWGLRAPPAMA